MTVTKDSLRRSIRVRLPDRPGALAELAGLMAAEEVNLVRLEVVSRDEGEVWDDFEVASSSDDRLAALIRSMRATGYEVVGLPRNWPIRDWALEVVETMAEIIEMDETAELEERLLTSLRKVAKSDHALFLSDDPDGGVPAAVSRWEALEEVSSQVDAHHISWSGDAEAIEAAAVALRSTGSPPPSRSPRNRIGGAAFLLGSTPRRGVVAAVGGRPPFLRAETEKLRRFLAILRPWLLRRERAVC